ncbi:MAG: hypothetical protein M3036_11235, partial [Bifidobacteriales bacterium]|nr:hypothetical protein [Bifidobacteriales bacterium]
MNRTTDTSTMTSRGGDVYPKAVVDPALSRVTPNPSFPGMEESVLDYWDRDDTFDKSVDRRPSGDHADNEFI